MENGLPGKALSDAERAVRLLIDEPRPRSGLRRNAYVAQGSAHMELRQYEEAAAALAHAVRLAQGIHHGHTQLAEALVLAGRFNEGIAAYDRALELQPRELTATLGRGVAFAKSGDLDRARQDFEAAAGSRRYSATAVLTSLCLAKAKAGLLAEALGDCNRADPHDAFAQTARGVVLLQAGQDRSALEAFTRSSTAPGGHNAVALYGRCLAQQRLGRRAAAKRDCAEARRNPRFATVQRHWFLEQGIRVD